ncbi:MAG: PAS domain-containing protein, partial [Gemmatimonadales bacterium]
MKDERKTKRQLIEELTDLRAALEESEERFRSLVELSPDTIAVHQDGKIVYVNAAAVRLMGAESAEQLVGTPALDRVHPDDRPIAAERIGRMLKDGVAAEPLVERFLRLDGTAVEVEVRAAPIIYGGRPAVQVVARDVTDRRRAEEAVRESEARYRKLVDPAPVGVYRTTLGGEILYANDALVEMFGFESFDEFAKDGVVVRYASPEDRKRLLEALRRGGSVSS